MGVLQLGMRMYSERSAALAPSPQHCEEIQNRERERIKEETVGERMISAHLY